MRVFSPRNSTWVLAVTVDMLEEGQAEGSGPHGKELRGTRRQSGPLPSTAACNGNTAGSLRL
eukprot:2150734-Rhodomonas_salina.5